MRLSSTFSAPKRALTVTQNQLYLNNFVITLNGACQQQPVAGKVVSLQGSLFSTTQVNITSPSAAATGTSSSSTTYSSSSSTISAQPQNQTQLSGGLSTGAKAGIGVGVSLGVLLTAGFGAAIFWWGKRSERHNQKKQGNEGANVMPDKAELGPGLPRRRELEDTNVPLSNEEQEELLRKRIAAELEGSTVSPVKVQSERAELEALRGWGNVPLEMG
ncbi:hypothetical protein V8E51_013882 [Hyaloscypha variabilis]